LFASRYWTKVNEVFASGQGEVRMALIKDDIGNWSLKSFDNNPEELLGAYREASIAGLNAVTKLVKKGTTPDAGLLGFAGNLSRGTVGHAQEVQGVTEQVEQIRAETAARLQDIKQRYAAAAEELSASIEAAKQTVASETARRDAEQTALDAAKLESARATAARQGAESAGADATALQPLIDAETQKANEVATREPAASAANTQLALASAELQALTQQQASLGTRALAEATDELRSHRRATAVLKRATTDAAK
jgi:hypothetical protein